MTIQENVMRRAQGRSRVLKTAAIVSPDGSHSVLVRDISRHGAQVYSQTIQQGHDACFTKGAMFVAARIEWSRKGVAGLRFYRELSACELEAAFPFVELPRVEGKLS